MPQCLLTACLANLLLSPLAATGASGGEVAPKFTWRDDYSQAVATAISEKKMLFIFFHRTGEDAARDAFEAKSLRRADLASRSDRYVWLKLPLEAAILLDGEETRLLEHAAFAHMHGRQGVAIIDYASPEEENFGDVVSMFPFDPGKYYAAQSLSAILDLPLGTLTQRTMIFAVKTHPDHPLSTQGLLSPALLSEAERHSRHQAKVRRQGHHAWEKRFHRINARLGGGMMAREVVAESWPKKNLVEACRDCVDSWRQSPGHWNAVRGRHAAFGYDIKQGANGIWYATGIFGGKG